MCVYTLNNEERYSFSPPYWVDDSEQESWKVTFPKNLRVHSMTIEECENVLRYLNGSGSTCLFEIMPVENTEPMFNGIYGQEYATAKEIREDLRLEEEAVKSLS